MHLAYFDETGDDGFPNRSSELFVLTACYLDHLDWRSTFETIRDFRRSIRMKFGFPLKWELHTRPLLLNKNPYGALGLKDADRIGIIDEACNLLGSLPVKIINIVIVKPRIRKNDYQVLDTAFTYAVQRLENDILQTSTPGNRFMIITDEGRLGVMRKTARRLQRFNVVPSMYPGQGPITRTIQGMIEDPLEKNSRESYFIQMSDLVSYLVFLFSIHETGVGHISNRMPSAVTRTVIESWLDSLLTVLNLQAAKHKYGIKYHPT
jgi:hypothetical protein